MNCEPAGNSTALSFSAGHATGIALMVNSTVICWGNKLCGQCNVPVKLKAVKQVAGSQDTYWNASLTRRTGVLQQRIEQDLHPVETRYVTDFSAGCDHSMAI